MYNLKKSLETSGENILFNEACLLKLFINGLKRCNTIDAHPRAYKPYFFQTKNNKLFTIPQKHTIIITQWCITIF